MRRGGSQAEKPMKIVRRWRENIREYWGRTDLADVTAVQKKKIQEFLERGHNTRNVCLILAAVLLLAGIQTGKAVSDSGKYIVGKDGTVSGLIHEQSSEQASFPLSVEARKGRHRAKKEVTVVLDAEGKAEVKKQTDPEKELKQAIQKAVRDAETAGTRKVALPSVLRDGTAMRWERKRSWKALILLMLGPLLIICMYVQDQEKQKQAEKEKAESIFCALPGFNDQLIMLLNCGLVFSDAFWMIADGYRQKAEKNAFCALILRIQKRTEDSGHSLIHVLSETAAEEKNEDFRRFAETVCDSQKKGTDMLESLEKERDVLWESRKNAAAEKGKHAETRLAFPLALLLLVLIVITAAPAVIQVQ